ncbi:hypothetical protein A3H19_03965 [Candidatus Woesebacteria bacterium RIFCSPLOWO2_12_FULL_39_9]|nr:MAG: hypothetical protein A3H19_03965 [Candidatus Woesebacteria bacterium RIFCSPLOWO2_12_FULL_39_9]
MANFSVSFNKFSTSERPFSQNFLSVISIPSFLKMFFGESDEPAERNFFTLKINLESFLTVACRDLEIKSPEA